MNLILEKYLLRINGNQKMIGKAMIKEWVTSIESFLYETKANNCETMIKEWNINVKMFLLY